MKKLILNFITFLVLFSCMIFAQNQVYNIPDIKPPLNKIWSHQLNSFILNVKFNNDVCYVNTLDGIQAISLSTGNRLWYYALPERPTISSVVTFSDKYGAFLTYSYNEDEEKGLSCIYVIDLSNGQEIFVEKSDKIYYKPTVYIYEDKLYCIGGEPDDWLPLKEFFEFELDEANIFIFDLQAKKLAGKQRLSDEKSDIIDLQEGHLFIGYDYDLKSNPPTNKVKCYRLEKIKKIWDYNPSGMIAKTLVSKVIVKNDIAYLFPKAGSIGKISALKLADGDELMDESNVGADNIFFTDNMLFTYSIGQEKFRSLISWYAFDLNKNEEAFSKTLSHSVNIGIADIFGSILKRVPALGLIVGTAALAIAIPVSIIINKDSNEPVIIPSKFLFNNLNQLSIYTGSNLVAIYHNDEESKIKIVKPIEDDDTSIELKFEPRVNDLKLANFHSKEHVFITYNGKIASINLERGEQDWVGDFSINESSLGLVYHNNSYYLFTAKGLHKFSSNE